MMEGHKSWVGRVRASPDSSWLASGSHDGTVRVWKMENDFTTEEAVLDGHLVSEGVSVVVAWTPDGCQLLTGDDGGKVRVFDAGDWAAPPTSVDLGDCWVTSLSARASDALVLVGCVDGSIHVVDMSPPSGRVERTLAGVHTMAVFGLNWSPTEALFASGEAYQDEHDDHCGKAVIWSATTWAPVHELFDEVGGNVLGSMRWSPDSSRVLVACYDSTLRIFSALTGALERTMDGGSATHGLMDADWSPDGRFVAAAGDERVVCVWEAKSGALLRTLSGHSGWINGVDWTRGDAIASCGWDGTVRLWDVRDMGVSVSPSGVASSCPPEVRSLRAQLDAERRARADAERQRDKAVQERDLLRATLDSFTVFFPTTNTILSSPAFGEDTRRRAFQHPSRSPLPSSRTPPPPASSSTPPPS